METMYEVANKTDGSKRLESTGRLEQTSSNVAVLFKPIKASIELEVESYSAMRYHGQ